jgi:hypothetical protein
MSRLLIVAALVLASCAPAPTAWRAAGPDEWPSLRAELARLRQVRPREPWAAGLRATMRQPRSGRVLDARGGIAVAPGRALRMILVAGAGATMLDAWVTRDQWRIAVPPAGIVRRGGGGDPDDLPVGFLRWWFFRPLEGMLFAASRSQGTAGREDVFLLRDDDGSAVELRAGRCLRASRRRNGRTERVDECLVRAQPAPGDRVRYQDESSGLVVDLQLESLSTAPPDEDAFRDPDAPGDAG